MKRPTDIRTVFPMGLRMDIQTEPRHFQIQKERRKRNAPKVVVEMRRKNLEVFREQNRESAGLPLLLVRLTEFIVYKLLTKIYNFLNQKFRGLTSDPRTKTGSVLVQKKILYYLGSFMKSRGLIKGLNLPHHPNFGLKH